MKIKAKARPLSRALRSPDANLVLDRDKDVRESGCSVVTVHFNPDDGLIYCGLTTYTNDLLWTYNPATQEYKSCGYKRIAEPYEVKIHRSLVQLDGCIYGATACLHGDQERLEAPGGKLFRYDPRTDEIEVLAVPVKHEYIQSIGIDPKRRVIYGDSYPLGLLWSYDLTTKEVTDLGRGRVPDGIFCDNDGNIWGTMNRDDRVFKYNAEDGFTLFDFQMPSFMGRPDSMAECVHAPDDGMIYIGCSSGAVFSLDPESMDFKYLGHPLAVLRIHGMIVGRDGLIYGAGGGKGKAENGYFAYDRESKRFHDLGLIYDPDEDCYNRVAHCLTMTGDGTFFNGETDHPDRAGYLWEVTIER